MSVCVLTSDVFCILHCSYFFPRPRSFWTSLSLHGVRFSCTSLTVPEIRTNMQLGFKVQYICICYTAPLDTDDTARVLSTHPTQSSPRTVNSRKHGTVVTLEDFVNNRVNDSFINFNLRGRRSKHFVESERLGQHFISLNIHFP